ncbi:MAG: flagellar hook-associated protein FlgK [Candidatus Omnitrophica bacterium]|nr:flagellar hook-associated protein FlgK [Candidatus Omnitrophota bacterium]
MVTLFGIFEVGSRGLAAQQNGLDITGHNISNANTEGYSRQRANLASSVPLNLTPGAIPTGVEVQSITRLRDEFLDFQIRQQSSLAGFFGENEDVYGQIQVILQDPLNPIAELLEESASAGGINSLLKRFFSAFQELAGNPESFAVRATVRETATTLATSLNVIHDSLTQYQSDLNREIGATVKQINGIAEQIAKLNEEIARIESQTGNFANDARDTRDKLLTKLADIAPIETNERANGIVDVRMVGSSIVIGNQTAPFVTKIDPNDPNEFYQILNSVELSQVLTSDFDGGRLGALIQGRDQLVPDILDQVDQIAKLVIQEVNNVHSQHIGLAGFDSITSPVSIQDPAVTLDTAGFLDFPTQAGQFTIRVTDSDGVVQNLLTVAFDPSVDTLNSLAVAIDSADGLAGAGNGPISALVNADNQLEITSNGGLEFTFTEDTSHILAALGINTFFKGTGAGDISLSDQILDPELGLQRIAASGSGAEGDNTGALAIADLEYARVARNNSTTIGDFYREGISELGVRAQRNKTLSQESTTFLEDLKIRQESVAGVSLDEESVNLIKFQQAFNGAARYITIVDSLIDRVVNGLGITR